MYRFFATIHARPAEATPAAVIELEGNTYRTLHIPPPLLSQPFERDFESVIEAVRDWERMFVEPDGSFVWVSSAGAPAWQLDGNLHDRNELLLFVDVKGACPVEEFDRFLGALGWPATPLMFQLTREAVFLDEAEFRRWAARREPAKADATDASSQASSARRP